MGSILKGAIIPREKGPIENIEQNQVEKKKPRQIERW